MLLDFYQNSDEATNIIDKKRALIGEQTSPLQRIMWVYNVDEPQRRTFENNICAFHIGRGYFLSVAHNLRVQAGHYRSIPEELYRREVFAKLDGSQHRQMEQYYMLDEYTNKRYLNTADPGQLQHIQAILKQKRFDTRWVTMTQKNICQSYLIFQFKENLFYNDAALTSMIDPSLHLFDPDSHKHTFLVQVELVNAFYAADVALYKIVNMPQEVIDRIPSAEVCYDFLDDSTDKLYCLQSSPSGPAGRLLNQAHIEGMLDHFGIFPDEVGGNYNFEGDRYLIRGYFRFGSSGAPYLRYDEGKGKFLINAIQSEASGIQLSIKNDREGNFQYVNAIASPLSIIREELERYIGN